MPMGCVNGVLPPQYFYKCSKCGEDFLGESDVETRIVPCLMCGELHEVAVHKGCGGVCQKKSLLEGKS